VISAAKSFLIFGGRMKIFVIIICIVFTFSFLIAQEISWKKQDDTKPEILNLFHSVNAVNLPTAETLSRNELEYEISHRFNKTVDADKAYFGIDGPATIRMALSYAITNDLMVTFGRSNQDDNIDFRVKYKLFQLAHNNFPALIALRAGGAWNTEVYEETTNEERDLTDKKNFQYYGQAIVNTLIAKKIGIGIVPSYLYNSHIHCEDTEYSFTMGGYIQYYMSAMFSFYIETNATVTGWRQNYNPVAFGLEIETGGHFFKIFLGNSHAMNPSQYLAGADLYVENGEWRLGFNITRILKF